MLAAVGKFYGKLPHQLLRLNGFQWRLALQCYRAWEDRPQGGGFFSDEAREALESLG